MSFLSGLFGGSNPTLNSNINTLQGVGSFATNLGEKDTSTASDFMNSLLSGDQKKIGQVLAPQISSIQKQSQQQKQTASQFGNRSGGNNSSMQMADDKAKGSVNDLIASLTGGAAGSLGQIGGSLLNQGMSAFKQATDDSQTRLQNWQNSIFGKGITSVAQGAEAFGLGAAGGALPGGPGAAAGGQAAFADWLG